MDDVESSEEEEEEDEKVGELFWKGIVKGGAEPLQNTLHPMRNTEGETPGGCLELLCPPLNVFSYKLLVGTCWTLKQFSSALCLSNFSVS